MNFAYNLRRFSLGLILSSFSLCANVAHAWGQLKELRNENPLHAHLVYSVLVNHEINYCINIRDRGAGKFDFNSIDSQTQMALSLWLTAARPELKFEVPLNRVDCDSPSMDLMIDIGPQDWSTDANQQTHWNATQSFSTVGINTNFRYRANNGNTLPVADFRFVVERLPGSLSLNQAMLMANAKHFTSIEIGLQSNLEARVVGVTSYLELIHELGHSFGLCDTYQKGFDGCDAEYSSSIDWTGQPPSVMQNGRHYLYLTDDDIAGIRALFQRFSYLQRGEVK